MPTYVITSPEGKDFEVTAPEGASQDDVMAYAQANFPKQEAAPPLQAPVDPRQTGALRTLVDQFTQGATGGFGDEISDRLGAGIASLATDESYGDLLKEARENTRTRLPAQFEENPALTIGANIAGSVGMGGMAAGVLKGAAPNVSSKLAQFAAANPLTAAGGVGGVSGAVYGAGAGEGSLPERLGEMGQGAALGAVASPIGAVVGSKVLAPLADKLLKNKAVQGGLAKTAGLFEKKGKVGKAGSEIAAIEQTPIQAPVLQEGEIFSKTAGQRLQDPKIQRLENDARAAAFGAEPESAIRQADVIQNREFHSYINDLAKGLDKGKDPNVLVENAADIIKSNSAAAKAGVNSAYDLAREGKGVKIGASDIHKGLFVKIDEISKDYPLRDMNPMKEVIKDLASASGVGKLKGVSAAKLAELERIRSKATKIQNDFRGQSQGDLARKFVRSYDDFMKKTADEAVDVGDAKAINAFKTAVSTRAEYGRMFESNAIVEDIIGGKVSVDDTVKSLLGTGSIKGKKAMEKNYDAIVKASGGQSQAVQDDLRQAFTLKLFKRSASGYEPNNPNMEMISPARLVTELESMFVNQRKFAEKLYGKDVVAGAIKAIPELKLISSSQAGVRNPSGSGEWLGRFLRAPGVSRIPGVGLISQGVEAQKKNIAGGQVMRGLGEFIDEQLIPKSTLWSPKASVAAAAAANVQTEPKPKRTNTLADRIAASLQQQKGE